MADSINTLYVNENNYTSVMPDLNSITGSVVAYMDFTPESTAIPDNLPWKNWDLPTGCLLISVSSTDNGNIYQTLIGENNLYRQKINSIWNNWFPRYLIDNPNSGFSVYPENSIVRSGTFTITQEDLTIRALTSIGIPQIYANEWYSTDDTIPFDCTVQDGDKFYISFIKNDMRLYLFTGYVEPDGEFTLSYGTISYG